MLTGAPTRRRFRILLGIGLAASIVIGAAWWLRHRTTPPADPLAVLIAQSSRLDHRIVLGRLSGFPYRPWRRDQQSSESIQFARVLRLRGAAMRLLSEDEVAGAEGARVRGIAALFAGNLDLAVQELERACTLAPRDPRAWNDLAVALLERGRNGDVLSLIRARTAAQRAEWAAPDFLPAQFNRAMATMELHLTSTARRELEAAAGASPRKDRGWRDEIRARLTAPAEARHAPSTQAIIAELQDALAAGDDNRTRVIVDRHRQQSRGWAEVEFLAAWAEAYLQNDAARAASPLHSARVVGRTIAELSGDELLSDAVKCIDAATPEGKNALARAHLLYRRARLLQHARRPAAALPLFRDAASRFRSADSPMQHVARYWIANCLTDGGRIRDALQLIRTITPHVPPQHRNLRGLLAWQEGTALNSFGFDTEALEAYSRALAIFEAIGDRTSSVSMQSAVAAMHANLGRHGEAWRLRLAVFGSASESGDATLLQLVLTTAARTESMARRFDTAYAMFALAADLETSNPRLSFDAALWSAMAAHRMKWMEAAERHLRRARLLAPRVEDPALRAAVQNDFRFVEAVVARDPASAVSLWSAFIADALRRQDTFLLAQAYAERARRHRTMGRLADAERDGKASLELTETRALRISRIDVRDSYFATRADVVRELVDVVERRRGALAALLVQERWRGSIAGASERNPFDVAALRLPSGSAVAVYIALDDRLLVFAIDSKRVHAESLPVGRIELARMAKSLAASAQGFRYDRKLAGRLYDLLITPLRLPQNGDTTLIIVSDPAVDSLPFAALLDPQGRYLVEKATTVFASRIADAGQRPVSRRSAAPGRACIVGNPAFSQERFDLDPLPAAEREALDVARLYGDAPLLRGDATPERVIACLLQSDVVHVAAHSTVNPNESADSFLVLAPSPDAPGGALYLDELARLALDHVQVAVIASCRSAAREQSETMFASLATAFIAAGAQHAVGALWELDDSAAHRLMLELHRRLRSGTPPAAAVRDVQLLSLRTSRRPGGDLGAWAALRVHRGSEHSH